MANKSNNAKKIEEVPDYTEDLKRLQADFENYIKRTKKEFEKVTMEAKASVIRSLLSVVDSFEASLESINDSETAKGVRMIYDSFIKLLKEEGLEPIKSIGERLNPFLHEVLLKEESDEEEDTIIDEIQKGYLFRGLLLRSSKVKISKKRG